MKARKQRPAMVAGNTDAAQTRLGAASNPEKLALIVSFVAVAERRSFAEAAAMLSQTTSTVSRKIVRLEEMLGTRLFNRTTRTVALTEAGRIYHGYCRGVLDDLTQADAVVASMGREPQGPLRISPPVAFGHLHMSSAIVDFLLHYPKISVDVEYSDRFVDMINEDFDISIRIGSLPDSSIVARKIANNRRVLVAAPSYVDQYGAPASPGELAHHQCVRYSLYKSAGNVWRFRKGDRTETVNVNGSFRCDNSEAICEVVQKGLGIGIVAGYICYSQIVAGELVPILPEWQTIPESNIYICYSSTRFMSPKVRAFSDFMVDHFRNPSWANAAKLGETELLQ